MTTENSNKAKLKYFPPQTNSKCCCQEVSQRLETIEKQQNSLFKILAEHKILLDKLVSQNAVVDNIMQIFPINTVEQLKDLDSVLSSHSDPYKRQIKILIAGDVERNLHHIFGQNIIMDFIVDGVFGKKRLRDYGNVFTALIDIISTINDLPDKTLRTAFQRQKKKVFKQSSREKIKSNSQQKENVDTTLPFVEEQFFMNII